MIQDVQDLWPQYPKPVRNDVLCQIVITDGLNTSDSRCMQSWLLSFACVHYSIYFPFILLSSLSAYNFQQPRFLNISHYKGTLPLLLFPSGFPRCWKMEQVSLYTYFQYFVSSLPHSPYLYTWRLKLCIWLRWLLSLCPVYERSNLFYYCQTYAQRYITE